MNFPDWVYDAVFYQIFPDRFANGDFSNDPPNVQPWGATPTLRGFQGGDLKGVIQNFDYLLDLGINAIYLNPIFQSISNHRYNATDYYKIDPKLGTIADFQALMDLAHRNSVHVILDGVFNHTGRGFFAFNDLLENEEESPFVDWYHVNKFPLKAYGAGKAENYLAWWGFKEMPKLNTDNLSVRRYLLGVARYWIEQGADGWRLDVPNEIDDDSFWNEFRSTVKQVNSNAYLVGEIWETDPHWVADGHFDGLMNYPFRQNILDFIANQSISGSEFTRRIESLIRLYPPGYAYAHYVAFGSHDTERFCTLCGGNLLKVRLAFLLLFCYLGAPAIYYGDEIGMEGNKDPDNRRAFPWGQKPETIEMRAFVKRLISLRRRFVSLRRGDFRNITIDDNQRVCAFGRVYQDEATLVLANDSDSVVQVSLDVSSLGWEGDRGVSDVLNESDRQIINGHIELKLDPYGGSLLYGHI